MRNSTIWYTNCARCNARISNNGSGRPKKFCNANCVRQDRLNKMRVKSIKRSRAAGIMPRPANRITNRELLNAEKRLRNECALHLHYWGVHEFVIHGFEYLMDMDHIDRTTKIDTIAKMMGQRSKNATGSPIQKFEDEMAKCQMLCMKCHRRKTIEQKDWIAITKPLKSMIIKIFEQPSLFDDEQA